MFLIQTNLFLINISLSIL